MIVVQFVVGADVAVVAVGVAALNDASSAPDVVAVDAEIACCCCC